MLVIRLARTGRSGHAQFRFVVQDKRFSPSRGRVVAYLGNYDPHAKTMTIDGEKASQYLSNGAQPSDRVARLLQKEGIKLPDWVKVDQPKERTTRNPDKRRSTAPAQPAAEAPAAEPAADAAAVPEAPAEELPAEAPAAEAAAPEESAEETTPKAQPESEAAPAAEETPAPEAPAEDAADGEEA
jgi:small subunit ribosomal protein S16